MSAQEWWDSLDSEQLNSLYLLDQGIQKSNKRFKKRHVVDAKVVRRVAVWTDRDERDN
ncbi:MAG TPA: hypothetical protein VLG69_04170 [Candidatus Andersenbacteria bacterium]|nr:hypothetical protein [Candidatus Andersenbacteria bacterium]